MIAIARALVVACLAGLMGSALAGPFAYVTHQKISVIDVADNSFVTEIEVPLWSGTSVVLPRNVAVSKDGARVFVSNSYYETDPGSVSIVDTSTQSHVQTIDVGALEAAA